MQLREREREHALTTLSELLIKKKKALIFIYFFIFLNLYGKKFFYFENRHGMVRNLEGQAIL